MFGKFLDEYYCINPHLFRFNQSRNCIDVHLNSVGLGILARSYIDYIRPRRFNPIKLDILFLRYWLHVCRSCQSCHVSHVMSVMSCRSCHVRHVMSVMPCQSCQLPCQSCHVSHVMYDTYCNCFSELSIHYLLTCCYHIFILVF